MKKMTALLIAATGLTASCSATTNVTGGTVTPPPPTTYDVTVPHGQTVPNVTPPQQLHITFPGPDTSSDSSSTASATTAPTWRGHLYAYDVYPCKSR